MHHLGGDNKGSWRSNGEVATEDLQCTIMLWRTGVAPLDWYNTSAINILIHKKLQQECAKPTGDLGW